MSLCRSNRFLLHKHFFFVCTFFVKLSLQKSGSLAASFCLKKQLLPHITATKVQKIFCYRKFFPIFLFNKSKKRSIFLLPFPQNRNFSPNNLVVFDLHHGLYYVEFETKRINYAQEQSHSRLN